MVERKMIPKRFLLKEEKAAVVRAIQQAESKTSGEICVYLERKARGPLMARAKKIFEKSGLTRTKKRNGVLIYLSLKSHEFVILGDEGIDKAVGQDFWKSIIDQMEPLFKGGEFVSGLVLGIRAIGEKLAHYFPWDSSDKNELRDRPLS